MNEPLVIVNNVYILGCQRRPEKIAHTVTSRMIDFIKLYCIQMSPFVLPCKVAIVTEFCFMGSSFFLVILDTKSKVSFHIVLKSPL